MLFCKCLTVIPRLWLSENIPPQKKKKIWKKNDYSMVLLLCKFILKHWHNLSVTAPKDAMRKHHKKWNVVQSGHCTVVLLHLAEAAGRQHHGTVTLRLFNLGGCATSKCCTIIEAVGHIEQNKTQAIQSSNCGPLNPSHPGCSVSNRIGAKSLRLTQLTLISGSG